MSALLDDEDFRATLVAAGRERAASLSPDETARRLVDAYRVAGGCRDGLRRCRARARVLPLTAGISGLAPPGPWAGGPSPRKRTHDRHARPADRCRLDQREAREIRADDLRVRVVARAEHDRASPHVVGFLLRPPDARGDVEPCVAEDALHLDGLVPRTSRRPPPRSCSPPREACSDRRAPYRRRAARPDRVEDLPRGSGSILSTDFVALPAPRRPGPTRKSTAPVLRPRSWPTRYTRSLGRRSSSRRRLSRTGRDEERRLHDHAGLQHLIHDRPEELLLAADPSEVGDVVARQVARSHVRERLRPVQSLASGFDVQSGVRVGDMADVTDVDLRRFARPRAVAGEPSRACSRCRRGCTCPRRRAC